jgi:hypothetical protein
MNTETITFWLLWAAAVVLVVFLEASQSFAVVTCITYPPQCPDCLPITICTGKP